MSVKMNHQNLQANSLFIFACKAMSSSKSKESNFSSPVVGVVGVDQLELQCQLMEGQ